MFFLIDCNNFYASCEQVFQPELKNKPLVVLSNNDGCVIARSKEAKEMGIKMGDPAFLHKDKKILQTRSSNFALYGDLSERVMQTIETFNLPMQIYSIDESPINKIWGIGSRLSKKLKKHGIISAKDLIDQDDFFIRKLLGVNGLKTALELRQTPSFTLHDDPEHKKSIACCRSFYDKESSLEKINQTIATYTQIATEKMRSQNLTTDCICVMLSTSPFDDNYYSNSITLSLETASSYTPDLISLAKWGIDKIYKPKLFYKRCGVVLLDLKRKGVKQPSLLFPDSNSENKEKVIKTIDRINKKYDKNKVYFLAQGKLEKKPFINKSPSFTTNWNEIPTIRI